MCGIAGIVSPGKVQPPEWIAAMCDIIRHRGPDDFGYLGYQSEQSRSSFFKEMAAAPVADVHLGHRRLSILDLSEHGRQPLSYAGGRLWITFNGEIYNYAEIRRELQQKGYVFRTATDTEVVLAAYQEWGTDCLQRFNGMWAFAILDCEQQELFCARDRLGIKPFYYVHQQGRFAFASEIKQLLTLPWIAARANQGQVFDFLVFKSYGGESTETFFEGVLQLAAGEHLTVPLNSSTKNWRPEPHAWWDIDLSYKIPGWSDAAYAGHYLELLRDAVRLRLRADVPVGTCLSGGLDSSGIVCLTDQLIRAENPAAVQKTFTATSDDPRFDESEYARAVIDATQVDPHFTLPTPEKLLQVADKLIWHQDEPFISTSIFAGWCVFQLAREQGVTVTLDGQGPDEMLGGYTTMLPFLLAENLSRGHWLSFLRNYRHRNRQDKLTVKRLAKTLLTNLPGGHRLKRHSADIAQAGVLLNEDFLQAGARATRFLQQAARPVDSSTGGIFDRHLYGRTRQFTLPGILRQVDRNSMAFSIESRLPFLDYRLVEYTFALPSHLKIRDGRTKWVYRQAMQGILPQKVQQRVSKIGFATAEERWIKGAGKFLFREVYNNISPDAPVRRDAAVALLENFLAGKRPFDSLLWRIFNIECWRRQFMEKPVTHSAGVGGWERGNRGSE